MERERDIYAEERVMICEEEGEERNSYKDRRGGRRDDKRRWEGD